MRHKAPIINAAITNPSLEVVISNRTNQNNATKEMMSAMPTIASLIVLRIHSLIYSYHPTIYVYPIVKIDLFAKLVAFSRFSNDRSLDGRWSVGLEKVSKTWSFSTSIKGSI